MPRKRTKEELVTLLETKKHSGITINPELIEYVNDKTIIKVICNVHGAVFQYKCDEFYHPEVDGGISIIDDSLGIDWKIPTDKAILSEKDTKHPLLTEFDSPFIYEK